MVPKYSLPLGSDSLFCYRDVLQWHLDNLDIPQDVATVLCVDGIVLRALEKHEVLIMPW